MKNCGTHSLPCSYIENEFIGLDALHLIKQNKALFYKKTKVINRPPFLQFTKRARCLDSVAHVVDAILDREPSILDATASNGDTALHFACYEDNPPLVQVLLKRGCKVNVRNEIG